MPKGHWYYLSWIAFNVNQIEGNPLLLDGVPYRNWRRLFGNLEGWVASKEARVAVAH